ncbi:MAG: DNA polymerase III subunit alpha, partial [Parasporobacterium sp.]|nr:DNA polymerase III subunit alpha [Parasporobacterium sp.]
YQEQVMQIVRDLAGYSLGGADVLRRAMSKKKDYVMQAERKRFVYGDDSPENPVPGCIKNGISEQVANKIYDDMIDFAKYAFNKSHAAAYAIVAYQTAFLKYYYPTEYMASLMTSVMNLSDKLALYTAECRDLGIELLAPDINLAGSGFTPDGSNIRYGLSAIKGVGKNIIDNIISERESGGPFKDLHDFCERLAGKDINKRVVEGLIKAGALDSFGLTRKQLIHIYMDVLDEVNKDKKSVMAGQISFMDLLSDNEKQSFRPQVRVEGEYPKEVLLEFEKEVTGIYISGHPLNDYMEIIDKVGNAHTNDFLIDPDSGDVNIQDQAQVTVGGIITAITPKNARNGQPMAFLTVEDIFGTVEVIVFPKDYAVTRQYINTGAKVFIKGRATVESEANGKIIASKVIPFEMTGKQLWVRFKNIDEYKAAKLRLEAMLTDENNKGNVSVGIFLNEEKQRKIMPPEFNVNAEDGFIASMKEAFGDANVALSYTLGSMGR